MKKSELIKIVREELKGYSPQIGQTKGLTPDTLTKILTKIAKGEEDEVEEGMMFTKEKLMHLLPKGPELEYLLPDLIKTLNDFYANHHLNMKIMEEKEKGVDGKACWKGYRYAGTENGKDKCVSTGKKINAMSEQAGWPEEVPSRYGEIIFKLIKVMPDRAKYALIDAETGEEWEIGGRVYRTPDQLKAAAADLIKPQGGRQSSQF